MRKLIDIVLAAFIGALLTGCPDNKSSEETGPAGRGDTGAGEIGPKPATEQN